MTNLNVCRACLLSKDFFPHYFFKDVTPEMYFYCTSIEVKQDDDSPKALCQNCYDLLLKFHDFKKLCQRSQHNLEQLATDTDKSKSFRDDNLPVYYDGQAQDSDEDITKPTISIDYNKFFNVHDECIDNDHDNSLSQEYDVKNEPENEEPKSEVGSEIENEENVAPDAVLPDDLSVPDICSPKIKKPRIKRKRRKEVLDGHACDECRRVFHFPERLQAHKLEVHLGKKYKISCEPCKKNFKTWDGFKRHKRNEHLKPDPIECPHCQQLYKTKLTLKKHMLLHKGPPDNVCHICGATSTTRHNLKIHIETHNKNRERTHACSHCNKRFFTASHLVGHWVRMHSDRHYICNTCNSVLNDKETLKRHLLTHDGTNKPFQCDICFKFYVTRSVLKMHKRMHTGDRPFGCEVCLKAFINKKRLIEHKRTHTGEKPFKCLKCDKAFSQKGTLNRHKRNHNKGEKETK